MKIVSSCEFWLGLIVGVDLRCEGSSCHSGGDFRHSSGDLVIVVRWSIYVVGGHRRCWWVMWEITGMSFLFFICLFLFDLICWNCGWFGVDFRWNCGDRFGWFWVNLWSWAWLILGELVEMGFLGCELIYRSCWFAVDEMKWKLDSGLSCAVDKLLPWMGWLCLGCVLAVNGLERDRIIFKWNGEKKNDEFDVVRRE